MSGTCLQSAPAHMPGTRKIIGCGLTAEHGGPARKAGRCAARESTNQVGSPRDMPGVAHRVCRILNQPAGESQGARAAVPRVRAARTEARAATPKGRRVVLRRITWWRTGHCGGRASAGSSPRLPRRCAPGPALSRAGASFPRIAPAGLAPANTSPPSWRGTCVIARPGNDAPTRLPGSVRSGKE
jgi:hypothetical protein